MRVLILTSSRYGTASMCLPALYNSPRISVVKIVLAHAGSPNKKRLLKRKIMKTMKIGVWGALNGVRLRGWFNDTSTEDIFTLAERYSIPLVETAFANSDETRRIFREANADLGLSLGNGYIGQSVFSIPKYGMINIHGEILPDFSGAQSVIWPVYEGRAETGFTIHQLDKHIDTGEILYQKRYPIIFHPTLKETVKKSLETTRDQVPDALVWVCENYEELRKNAKAQGEGGSYTTPSFRQFLRMLKNNRMMYKNWKKI